MATKHKMICYAPFGLEPDAIEVLLTFTFLPGSRATRIDPADPAEVEFISATATLHTLDTGMQAMLDDWARDFLADTAGHALDQLSNVEAAIDRDLDEQGASPVEPLDLSELRAFWESVK